MNTAKEIFPTFNYYENDETPNYFSDFLKSDKAPTLKYVLSDYKCIAEHKHKNRVFYLWTRKENEYFLQVIDNIIPNFFVVIKNQADVNKEFERYTAPTLLPQMGSNKTIPDLLNARAHAIRNYNTPVDKMDGWFGKSYYIGLKSSLTLIEDECVLDECMSDGGCFIMSTAADYSHGYPPKSVSQTKFSGSFFEFKHLLNLRNTSNEAVVMVNVYYKGDNKDDIPTDVSSFVMRNHYMCADKYIDQMVERIKDKTDDEDFYIALFTLVGESAMLIEDKLNKFKKFWKEHDFEDVVLEQKVMNVLYSTLNEYASRVKNARDLLNPGNEMHQRNTNDEINEDVDV